MIMKISVVIPVYNGEKDVPDLINCLLNQSYPQEKVEYLLIDNNSSDRTLSILQNIAKNSPINIRIFSENNIQSSYAARNQGIRNITSDHQIIVFTDADCRPKPSWLEELIKPFINPETIIVAGEIIPLPGNSILEKFANKQETLSQKHTINHKFCAYGQTANLAIRKDILTKIGLFRPYLTTGGDADICWRILQANLGKLKFAPQAIVEHRHRVTISELASQWRRYGKSNRYLHELHGVELMREMTSQEYVYRLLRWLFKEIPKATINYFIGKGDIINFVETPIALFTANQRTKGQQEAKLPENAKMIEWN